MITVLLFFAAIAAILILSGLCLSYRNEAITLRRALEIADHYEWQEHRVSPYVGLQTENRLPAVIVRPLPNDQPGDLIWRLHQIRRLVGEGTNEEEPANHPLARRERG